MFCCRDIVFCTAAGVLAASSVAHAAAYTWNPDAANNRWHDVNNWLIDDQPANSYPSSASDTFSLNENNSVIIDAPGAAGTPDGSGNKDTIITINDGGVLATSGANGLRFVSHFIVNDGGTLDVSSTTSIRTPITINAGGTMIGSRGFSNDLRTVTVGGNWQPLDTTGNIKDIRVQRGNVDLTTGQIVLDVFGDNEAEHIAIDTTGISSGQGVRLNLAAMDEDTYLGGTILLQPQGGYVPQIGDSFRLVTVVPDGEYEPILNLGDGSNIILEGYTLDLSRWNVDADSDGYPDAIVTVVPEPASVALAAVAGVGLLMRRRSRARRA